jgi:hypothetical protein
MAVPFRWMMAATAKGIAHTASAANGGTMPAVGTLNTRSFLGSAAASLILPPAGIAPGHAQEAALWPARTIMMIVPFPPGGQADLAARPVAACSHEKQGDR